MRYTVPLRGRTAFCNTVPCLEAMRMGRINRGFDRWFRGSAKQMKYFQLAVMMVVVMVAIEPQIRGLDPGDRRLETVEARARVKLLESAYMSMLQHMHRRYFDGNEKAAVPSSVLEDVFRRVDYENGTKSRWIAVNTPAMDPKHEPNDPLTKEIASFLKSNNNRYEKVIDDKLVSGRAITLFGNCQKCHVSALAQQNGGRKVAGLIIEIPLVSKLTLEK